MKKFADLYKNKLMEITFINNHAKEVFDNKRGSHYPGDYADTKKVFKRYGLSTAFYTENVNETCLDVPDGWIFINVFGELDGAGGKYKKFMDLNSGVTELEDTIRMDVSDIYAGKYDVIYAMDYIDLELNMMGQLSYRRAKKVYEILMNIPNMEKELCSMCKTKYSMEIEKHLDALTRNAIEYAGLRMKWSIMSDEEAIRRNSERTTAHDLLIQCITNILLHLKKKGMDDLVDKELIDCLNNRKQAGDLACCIAYVSAIKAR